MLGIFSFFGRKKVVLLDENDVYEVIRAFSYIASCACIDGPNYIFVKSAEDSVNISLSINGDNCEKVRFSHDIHDFRGVRVAKEFAPEVYNFFLKTECSLGDSGFKMSKTVSVGGFFLDIGKAQSIAEQVVQQYSTRVMCSAYNPGGGDLWFIQFKD